jgi:hypothetical protein
MVNSLQNIDNPWLRSISAAVTVSSVITYTAAIAMGVTHVKDESAYKAALYASLMGAGGGALFGLSYKGKRNHGTRNQVSSEKLSLTVTEPNQWRTWRDFVVFRKVKESEEITSFYLQPVDKGELPGFLPGQFLTIKLDIPEQAQPIIRTYSLSDYPEQIEYYRLSIKRELTPDGLDVPPGISSNFMHDHVQEGSIISAKPPNGKFYLEVQKSLPAVLISNGVGITPMISMAKAASRLNRARKIWFVHGARDGRFHAFRDEILEVAQQNPNLTIHFAYSRPRPEDAGLYQTLGYADTALIQSLVKQDAEYFLCGSPSFLQSLREGLTEIGVPEAQIFFEVFSKAPKTPMERSSAQLSSDPNQAKEISFVRSGKTLVWDGNTPNILEFAEANGLNPPYSCRQGICGTCQGKILEGEVEYLDTPVAEIEEGHALTCISVPKSEKIVFDL